MASCDTTPGINIGDISHAAFAAWMRVSLSQMFNATLHEPLPEPLLVILDAKIELGAAVAST